MPRKVLIIDDIATNRIVLNVKLSAAGYQVAQVASLREGLAMVRQERPDIVLATARPDKMSALEFMQRYTADPKHSRIPVIMLMEAYDKATRLVLLKAGATDVMPNPIERSALLARFRSILRRNDSLEDARLAKQMSQSFGFGESAPGYNAPLQTAIQTAILTPNSTRAKAWLASLPALPNTVFSASSEAEILKEHSESAPDVVAVEVSAEAPEDGLCLLADLRAHPKTRHAGLIAVIAAPNPLLYSNALDRGADDILPYGYCPEELALRIATLAARKRSQDHRRAHMHEGLRAAVTDPLTGLHNRRFALPKLEQILAEAAVAGQSCAIMALDVDHFKRINDELGHTAGDAALVALAGVLQQNIRSKDLVARIGGEEFLVLMPKTSSAAAQRIATRLCSVIARHPFHLASHIPAQHLTVSIGVATQEPRLAPGSAGQAEALGQALLEQADSALYRSKRHGRNQVTMSARSAA